MSLQTLYALLEERAENLRLAQTVLRSGSLAGVESRVLHFTHIICRGNVRADALGSVLQVHVGRFWGLLGWDTFLVSDLGWETGFGLLSPS